MAVRGHRRTVLAIIVTFTVLLSLGWYWQKSLLPHTYSVMDRGQADHGGGPASGMPSGRSVATLTGPTARPADVSLTLVARKQRFTLASGKAFDGYTLNSTSPGPLIRAVQGQLVQVRLVNESVPDGITLHWHGVDVPGAQDGVAGVTQDAVPTGGSFTYRFVATQAGTFWYHSHQISHEQVLRGLLGPLVITPPKPVPGSVRDQLALVHLYGGVRTVNGRPGDTRIVAPAGSHVRVRVINTDNGPMSTWVGGATYRLVAVDGTDLHEPSPLTNTAVVVTAGGRADLLVQVPADGSTARVELGGNAALALGPAGAPNAAGATAGRKPAKTLDMLSYGTPAPPGFDPAKAKRHFDYVIGRRPGFVRGRPGMWWTVNGHLFPDVPMFVVAQGDVVRMRVENHSGEVHPMHLHGHHAVVLSRNGVASTGSPWWVDSLNVLDGESYDLAFVADNPGIWMDHCHNLKHATEGLVAHLTYEGVTLPFRVGGRLQNQPE